MIESVMIGAAIVLDRLTKLWARTGLRNRPGMQMDVVPGVVEFRYVENTGAAFSIFQEHTWLLTIVSSLIIGALVFFLLRYGREESLPVRMCIAAIIGGAVGNLLDRLFYGFVVDFINPVFTRFAVFNVADMFVSCGAILLVFLLLFLRRKKGGEEQHE